ncbi:MAG: thioredoxin domain-containing protein, partial [Rhodothermales bacterium]
SMSNRLADEQSPYLLQHKDNPVDWYPWSEEAFEKAREEDRPIFLSIGYSTCHWCHVMEHESFEDEEVAALMNEAFVPIKVDREERPDVDGVYMTACQMMTGQGGWPLTVIMTPDKKPFHVATYVPKNSRFGRAGMTDLIPRLKDAWENRREEVMRTADEVVDALQSSASPAEGREGEASHTDPSALERAYRALRNRFDSEHGGFGRAPKFPSPQNLLFLLRYWERSEVDDALRMVEHTLDRMRRGGIYDHLGFGFHRYSTDRRWLLPHFEKMLYDQALLTTAYVEAWQATGRPLFKRTAEEIIEYVLRDMQSDDGVFFSAEDADSEGREGTFYVWTTEDVREVLSAKDAGLFIETFNLSEEGNFEEESTGRRTGENVPHLQEAVKDLEDPERLEGIRRQLFEARERRVRPGRDDKVLTDWNGLTIAALSKASAAFGNDAYAEEAARAAAFLLDRMVDDSGRLLHRYRNGEAAVDGMLADYAYLIWGLIELYEATFDVRYLRRAVELQSTQIDDFWDEETAAFFATAHHAEPLIVRQKELHDGAMPSANAVSTLNMLRLARLTGKTDLEERAAEVIEAASSGLARMPSGFTGLLAALAFAHGPSAEVVIAAGQGDGQARELLREVRRGYRPNQVVHFRTPENEADLVAVAPFTATQTALDGKAAVYVCRDFLCEAPVTDAESLRQVLDAR